MSFMQFISILRARWKVAAAVFALVLLGTLAVSLIRAKQYEATSSVVVDFKPDPISNAMYGGMPSPAVMATQVDIINSERVALRVVRLLRLTESAEFRRAWQSDTGGQGSMEQWMVALLQRELTVQPSRESSVIRISYQAPDPRYAAAMANAFAQAYIDTALELRVNPARQYTGFFDQQVKEHRENFEKAQAKLSAFQKEKGIIATDERFDIETARLSELSSQLVGLQALAGESRSREVQAGAAGDRMQEVLNNPVVAGLRADISRSEARLKEISARLGDNHPAVLESRASLAELRSRIEAETKRVTGGVGVTSTINTQREAQVRAALEQQRERVLKLKAVRDEAAVLQRDVDNAQRIYDAVQGRLAQSTLESQTTQGNVNLLTQAVAPIEHSSPRLLLNLLAATFVGAMLAAGIAALLELLDRRVRGADDIVGALDLPVVGVLPKPGARSWRRKPIASPLQRRLMASLPSAPNKA